MPSIKFPQQRYGCCSLPHDSDATQALAAFYAEHGRNMVAADFILAASHARGKYNRVPQRWFEDGYQPFSEAELCAGSCLGDVIIAIPFVGERPLTVHTIGGVPDDDVDRVARKFLEELMARVGDPAQAVAS